MSAMSRSRTQLIVVGMFVTSLSVSARPADASSITNIYSFSGSTTDTMVVQPFNPALGTLDSVDVGISGVLSVSGTTGLNLLPGPGGQQIPIPYNFQVTVTQNFFGLGGKYFEFNDDAMFVFNGTSTGLGEGFGFAPSYGYTFTFNAVTDLIGFVIPTTSTTAGTLQPPLSGVSGPRADFLQTIIPLDQISFAQIASGQNFSPTALPLVIGSASTSGFLEVTYNYTAAVPEPSTWTLIVLGAAAAVASRRRRRR